MARIDHCAYSGGDALDTGKTRDRDSCQESSREGQGVNDEKS